MGHEPEPPTGCQRGGAFYDQPGVFERYRAHAGPSNPNLVMEEPAFLEELGSVDGLRVLDLGCGDATLGRLLLDAGCRSYVGIDGSMRMVHAAETILRGTNGKALHADIEDFSASSDAYDLVVSRMALHYVGNLEPVLAAAFESLSPSGRLVLTVVHPVITSHDARANTEELRGNWVVDDYFVAGPREQNWLGGTVVWHHRTVETYVAAVRRAGFDVTAVGECAPRREHFGSDAAEFERRQRIPMFLLIAGVKA